MYFTKDRIFALQLSHFKCLKLRALNNIESVFERIITEYNVKVNQYPNFRTMKIF